MKVDNFYRIMDQRIQGSDLETGQKERLKDRLRDIVREALSRSDGGASGIRDLNEDQLEQVRSGLVRDLTNRVNDDTAIMVNSLFDDIYSEEQRLNVGQEPGILGRIIEWIRWFFLSEPAPPAPQVPASRAAAVQAPNVHRPLVRQAAAAQVPLPRATITMDPNFCLNVAESQYQLEDRASSVACTFNAAEAALWIRGNLPQIERYARDPGSVDSVECRRFFEDGVRGVLTTGARERAEIIDKAQGDQRRALEEGTEFEELDRLSTRYRSLRIPQEGDSLFGIDGLSERSIQRTLRPLLTGENPGRAIFCTINGLSILFCGSSIPGQLFIFDPHRREGILQMVDALGASDYLIETLCGGDTSQAFANFYTSAGLR